MAVARNRFRERNRQNWLTADVQESWPTSDERTRVHLIKIDGTGFAAWTLNRVKTELLCGAAKLHEGGAVTSRLLDITRVFLSIDICSIHDTGLHSFSSYTDFQLNASPALDWFSPSLFRPTDCAARTTFAML